MSSAWVISVKLIKPEEMKIEVIRYVHEWCMKVPKFWRRLGCRRCHSRIELLDLLAELRLYDIYVPLIENSFVSFGGWIIKCDKTLCCLYPWPRRLMNVFWVRLWQKA